MSQQYSREEIAERLIQMTKPENLKRLIAGSQQAATATSLFRTVSRSFPLAANPGERRPPSEEAVKIIAIELVREGKLKLPKKTGLGGARNRIENPKREPQMIGRNRTIIRKLK